LAVLDAAAGRGLDVAALRERLAGRAGNADRFTAVYRRYCWPSVQSDPLAAGADPSALDGLRLAPFQVLASEGAQHTGRDHGWQLALADRLVAADPELFTPTRRLVVPTASGAAAAAAWWEEVTGSGGEGMVVKPFSGASGGRVQPGVKCRGREYLRIIYGPDYTDPARLDRLRQRGLGRKRSMAMREHILGLAALDRVAAGEPLWRVHEMVFAVLATESEPVDPRL
jgi:hypothetical protein